MNLADFLSEVGNPSSYYPTIARLIGLKESILLCHMIWWSGKQSDPDGWIYKTQDELLEALALSKEEQRTARKHLKEMKLLEEKEDRLAHRTYYRPLLNALGTMWESNGGQKPSNPPPARSPEVGVPDAGVPATPTPGSGESRSRLYTVITAVSTSVVQKGCVGEPVKLELKVFPEKLRTVRFEAKWMDWLRYRVGMKKCKDFVALFNEQIDWLSTFDEPNAYEVLSASLRNGYQGLFPPRGPVRQNGNGEESLPPGFDWSKHPPHEEHIPVVKFS
jgi:hypothetical protein